MTKRKSEEIVEGLQNNEEYILLNNPLASPKFIRTIGKGNNKKEFSVSEIYTPKVFYEIVSRLKPEHLQGIQRTESIKLDINIKKFIEEIGGNPKNYKHLIESVNTLQNTLLKWKDEQQTIVVAIVSKSVHNEKSGKIELYVDSDLAKRILEIREKENFSFLKSNVFRLQNAQAIKLYPFFKSWLNYCFNEKTGLKKPYEAELDRFKEQFGYDTSGYDRFNKFKTYVLDPATEEINEKTDIQVRYELRGDNLEGLRPRVTGLVFWITPNPSNQAQNVPTTNNTLPESPLGSEPTAIGVATAQGDGGFNPESFNHIQPQHSDANNIAELYSLFKKIPIKQKVDEVASNILIDKWVRTLGFESVKDGFLGMIATKAQPQTIAFFTLENLQKYTGYTQKHLHQEKLKKEQLEKKRQQQEQERLFKNFEYKFVQERDKHYYKKFTELDEQKRTELLETLYEVSEYKEMYFINGNKKIPNSYAVEYIGQQLTFPNGYNHYAILKSYIAQTFGFHVEFDADGKVITFEQIPTPNQT